MAKKPIIRYFDRGVWYDATVSDIGNLEDLNTVHKTTVVEAINDIIGGNINISGELLEKLTALDNNISRIDGLIASGSLNETQANQMNQFVTNKLNELNQSMEEMNKQRDQRLKEQEEKVAQLKLDSESDKQRIEEITLDLNATKEKLNNAELNVTSVTQLVDEINGKISQAVSKTDFDLLEGTVREQKTLIDQTVEGIKLLATKEELDKSNENVKSIKSALEVQAGLIESKVSSEQLINEIEKIDKYMPNLLRYTRNWQDWENDDEANIDVTLNEYRDCIIQRARGIGKGLSTTVEDLVIGETYSLSVWVKHDDMNAKLYAMVDNVEIIMTDLNSEETFVSNEFKRMRCSFVAQSTTAKVRFIFKDCRTDSYGYLAGAKCEKNKKVSGWQPHSEDVYQSIKSARSEIKQTDGKITTLVETVNKQGDLITSHTTSIEETDKAIKLQAESIKTLDESIESAKAELKVNSDAISSKVWKTDVGEMISDINIDNKNRVLNSDFGDGWELWSETNNLFQLKQIGNYKFAVAERSGLPQNMAIAIATNKFPVKHNERLMFGFYFYCADLSKLDNKIVCALELLDINDIRIDRVDFDVSKLSLENGSFTKLTNTYFVEDERIVKARLRFFLNRNGNVGFALPMAQGGDIKSSDWSLAPEDVARRFNDTNVTITNYEQTVDGFRQTVESYKGSVDGYTNQVSEFNQTVNGFSQTIKDYKESNDKRVQQLETSLTTESGKIEAVVKESAGTKDELGKLTANGGRISQLELTAQGLKSTVASQTSSIQTIQTDTTNTKQLANSAVSTANTAKSNADKAIADVASLTKTVSSQSTKIDQTSSKIDLVASDITEVGNKLDNLKLVGENLMLNGYGEFGNNKNFYRYVFDGENSYNNRPSFKTSLKTTLLIGDDRIPIDINKAYQFSMNIKSDKGGKILLGWTEYDIDGKRIQPCNVYALSRNATTILSKDLNDGDTVVYLDSTAGWVDSDKNYQNGLIFWNYRDSTGYLYPEGVYSRNVWFDLYTKENVNKTNNTITLKSPWNNGTIPAGTKVSQSNDGGTYKYRNFTNSSVPTTWTNTSFGIGEDHQLQAPYNYDSGRFSPAAKSIAFVAMWSYGTSVVDTYYINSIELKDIDSELSIDKINNNLSNNYYQKTIVDSKLSTTVDGITAQYTQDINTKLGNYYDKSTIDSKLTIDGKGITTYVKNTQNQLDNLQIGGRNYLIGTNEEYKAFNLGRWSAIISSRNLSDLNLKVGDYITASCDLKVPSNAIKGGRIRVQFFNSDDDRPNYYGSICNIGEEKRLTRTVYIDSNLLQYKRIDLIIESTNTNITANESGIQSRHEKLEIGNKATDWASAPEDLQVGGRNYLSKSITPGANFYKSNEKLCLDLSINKDSYAYFKSTIDLTTLVGKTVTFSFDSNMATGRTFGIMEQGLGQITNIKAGRNSYTFIFPNSIRTNKYELLFDDAGRPTETGVLELSNFKLEIGNQATDWSPAPEDMATAEQAQQAQNDANEANSKADATEHRVNIAESTIKQLSDSISMMVTDSNGSSMMTQTSDGWTFNIGAITDAINSATNNIDNLSGSLSQTKNVVNNLNNLANDLSKKTAYINMTTDSTGAPCIELGKTGNAFKVRITNTSVDFIQGSSKIAYVSNQALFIEKAIIKSELQVGEKRGFIWKTRSNGNMGLRWFG